MRWITLGRLLAPVLMIATLVLGSETGVAAAGLCAVAKPLKNPAKMHVVGNGTAASCTPAALREAVQAGGHVVFDCGGAATITVPEELQVSGVTVIDGAGRITLDGRHGGRILRALINSTLSVRNLHLINGGGPSTGRGGAISGDYRNRIEVVNSTLTNNSATDGGGAIAMAAESRLTVLGTTFRGNKSGNVGGAIYSLLTELTVDRTTFTGNSAATNGGGILTDGAASPDDPGTIQVCGATFRDNTANGSGGGGFFWAYAPQKIIVDRTSFYGNKAATGSVAGEGHGGAARLSVGLTDNNKNGTLIVQNTSVRSNSSRLDGGAFCVDRPPICEIRNSTFYKNRTGAFGGAVFGGGHHDKNVTYAQNSAGDQGGAIFGGKNSYDNTVFVGNSADNQWGIAQTCNTSGTGKHVVQWGTKSPDTSEKCIPSVVAKDPLLTDPARNDGSTLSMMPAAGSPLLGAGAGCEPMDQRAVARDKGRCDIGAVQRTTVVKPSSSATASASSPTPSIAGSAPGRTATRVPTSVEPALAGVARTDQRSWSGPVLLVAGLAVVAVAVLSIMAAHRRKVVGTHRPAGWFTRAGGSSHRRPVTPFRRNSAVQPGSEPHPRHDEDRG